MGQLLGLEECVSKVRLTEACKGQWTASGFSSTTVPHVAPGHQCGVPWRRNRLFLSLGSTKRRFFSSLQTRELPDDGLEEKKSRVSCHFLSMIPSSSLPSEGLPVLARDNGPRETVATPHSSHPDERCNVGLPSNWPIGEAGSQDNPPVRLSARGPSALGSSR